MTGSHHAIEGVSQRKASMEDVIVVGGGHVGLYACLELTRQGFQVLLVDQKKEIGERIVCTGIIGEEAFERFQLPEDTVIGRVQQVRFHSPGGLYFDYSPPKVLARVVDRALFNRYFAAQALRQGARIETEKRVDHIRIKKDAVTVKTTDSAGHLATHEAKVLILATGVNYKLFEWLRLQAPKNFLGGAQIQVPFQGEEGTHVYFGCGVAPGSFAWWVPTQQGIARVGLLSENNPRLHIKRLLDRIHPGWQDDVGEKHIDLRPVVQEPLEKSYADRVLVVGEAAGQIKTTTGGGIYYGLVGAQFAVEVLKEAFRRNRFTSDILSRYDRRWKRALGDEIRLGYYFRKICARLTDEQMDELFDRMVQDEVLNLAYQEAEFDWHKSIILSIFKIGAVRRIFQNPF